MTNHQGLPVSKPLSRLMKTGVLDAADISAAVAIENAVVSILTHDIRSTRHDMMPGAKGGDAEARFMRHFDARHCYYDWLDAMQAAGIAAGPVLDVILEGRPLHNVDKAWCKRKGWTREVLKRALYIYQAVWAERMRKTSRLTG